MINLSGLFRRNSAGKVIGVGAGGGLSAGGDSPTSVSLARSRLLGSANVARSERDLTKVTKVRVRSGDMMALAPGGAVGQGRVQWTPLSRPKMKTTTMIVSDPASSSSASSSSSGRRPDVVHEPLGWQLVQQTGRALQGSCDDLVKLYKRISLDHTLDEEVRVEFLRNLVASAEMAQQTLRPLSLAGGSSSTLQSDVRRTGQVFSPPGPGSDSDYPYNFPQSYNIMPKGNKGPSWC